jgi:small subunit ribosomal protein S20
MLPRPSSGRPVAQHKSAKKRARQALKRHERNRRVRSGVKTSIKKVRGAVTAGDAEAARQALPAAESLIRRAASKGVIPKARADRQVARLARATHQLGS